MLAKNTRIVKTMAEKEYIEREEVREAFYMEFDEDYADDITDRLPASDVQEVKHGKNLTKAHPVDEFICSECGYMTEDCTEKKYSQDGDYCYLCEYEYKFCPNCGAKMDKEENNDKL